MEDFESESGPPLLLNNDELILEDYDELPITFDPPLWQ
jgi:hypothetical protein